MHNYNQNIYVAQKGEEGVQLLALIRFLKRERETNKCLYNGERQIGGKGHILNEIC